MKDPSAQHGIIILHDYSSKSNLAVINITFKFFNDFVHDSVMDTTYDLKAKLCKATLYVEFKLMGPEGAAGSTRPLKSVIDLEKFLNGINGNVFLRTALGGFIKSMDFEPKFPMNPVNTLRP